MVIKMAGENVDLRCPKCNEHLEINSEPKTVLNEHGNKQVKIIYCVACKYVIGVLPK